MPKQIALRIGTVREIESESSYHRDSRTNQEISDNYGGLRIRVEVEGDYVGDSKTDPNYPDYSLLPWCFPLLPKTFQSIPKLGEAVIVFVADLGAPTDSQRYYIGPVISQPQFNNYCSGPQFNAYHSGGDATSLLDKADKKPLEAVNKEPNTVGSFPRPSDVAVIGRGKEDVILRHGIDDSSEIQLRAGIRGEPTNDPNPNMKGDIIFNDVDPAYIQLKHKKNLTAGENLEANSVINIVADRINIMSNKDNNIADNIKNRDSLVSDGKLNDVMVSLQPVPLGHNLFDLLSIMKMCILHHVHPWAGMEQCGDWGGYIKELEKFDLERILSKYVRIS